MRLIIFTICLLYAVIGRSQFSSNTLDPGDLDQASLLYSENGRMGLQKNVKKIITPPIYDTLYQVNTTIYVGQRFNTTRQQSYWGALNSEGNQIIPFRYLTLETSANLFIVGFGDHNQIHFGALDFSGKEVLPPIYQEIKALSATTLEAKKGGKTMLFNIAGVKLAEFTADSVMLLSNDLIKTFRNGKAGMTNLANNTLIVSDYKDIDLIDNEIFVADYPQWYVIQGYDTITLNYDNVQPWVDKYIVKTAKKYQLINSKDQSISIAYDSIAKLSNQLALVMNNDYWGAINNIGQEIIPLEYLEIIPDIESLAVKSTNSTSPWAILDFYGFPKSQIKYEEVGKVREGRLPIKRKGKWGYLDRYGVEIVSPIFDYVSDFKTGRAAVTFFGESGIIDRNGKWILAPIQSNIHDFTHEVILQKVGAQYQIMDYNGELIYFSNNELQFDQHGYNEIDSLGRVVRKISWAGTIISDIYSGERIMTGGSGLYIFKANERYGFKDYEGRIIIANRYEGVAPFNDGLAAIKINNKWGFINIDENIIIQPRYDSVGHFDNGNCITYRNGSFGIIDESGGEIIANKYQAIERLAEGDYRVQQDGKWGVINNTGGVLIHTNYDQLLATNQGFYIVERNDKYGTIDNSGVNKIPFLYDYIGYEPNGKTLMMKKSPYKKWAFLKKAH